MCQNTLLLTGQALQQTEQQAGQPSVVILHLRVSDTAEPKLRQETGDCLKVASGTEKRPLVKS